MKTIVGEAKELGLNDDGWDGFNKGIEFAQRWIPVTEELPNADNGYLAKRVLVKERDGYLTMAYYSFGRKEWVSENDWLVSENVTHWRPIEVK